MNFKATNSWDGTNNISHILVHKRNLTRFTDKSVFLNVHGTMISVPKKCIRKINGKSKWNANYRFVSIYHGEERDNWMYWVRDEELNKRKSFGKNLMVDLHLRFFHYENLNGLKFEKSKNDTPWMNQFASYDDFYNYVHADKGKFEEKWREWQKLVSEKSKAKKMLISSSKPAKADKAYYDDHGWSKQHDNDPPLTEAEIDAIVSNL